MADPGALRRHFSHALMDMALQDSDGMDGMGFGDLAGLGLGLGPLANIGAAASQGTTMQSLNEILLSDDEESIVFTQKDLASTALPIMEGIRRRGQLCDVTLKVGEHSFHAHRIVLASTIPYFHAMFTNDMMESRQGEIEIRGVDPSALEDILNFSYSGKLTITVHNVQSLAQSSSFLQMSRVRDACADFLTSRLSPFNVLGVKHFADSLGCQTLVKECQRYIRRFFGHMVDSEEFLGLTIDELMDIANDDELHVGSEEIVFNAVLKWVKHDVEGRRSDLPRILKTVRLPILSPQFLTDHVASEELIRTSLQCRDLLDEARDFHLLPERRSMLRSFKVRPRRCHDSSSGLIYVVGGQTKAGNSLSTVEVYDPESGTWSDAEHMSMLRSRVGVAVVACKLYAIGGYNGSERLNTVEVLDAKTKRWARVASMNYKRSAVGAAALHGDLYVCGGFDGISSLDTVECFRPESNTWTMVASLSKHRSAAGVVNLEDKHIYACGGHNGLSIFDSVERYDPITNDWTEVPSMLSKRCRVGAASLNGRIYICGGYDGSSFLKSVEMFDPATNCWQFVSSMNVTRSRVAALSCDGRLWAIGGYDGMKNLSTVEVYDPETDEWTFVAPMESHEGGVGVGVIPLQD